jgi:hypothetical protein
MRMQGGATFALGRGHSGSLCTSDGWDVRLLTEKTGRFAKTERTRG